MHKPLADKISLADFLRWEQTQSDRFEWVDGVIVPLAGVSFEHAAISSNLNALFHAAVGSGPCFVQPSDRQLIPRDKSNRDLGSFYADLFVSCAPEDRSGNAAHFPTVVVEVLSPHVGEEFMGKRLAYLGSRDLLDYLIVASTGRHVLRYGWKVDAGGPRRLITAEYLRGPVPVPCLGLTLSFDQIYAGTDVASILYPIPSVDGQEADIQLDAPL